MQNENPKRQNWLEIALLSAPFLFLAALWDKFPARVPIHWNIRGNIDGWASKPAGLLMLPLVNLFIYAIFTLTRRFDPRLRNLNGEHARTLAILDIFRPVMLAFMLGIFSLQATVSLGYTVPMNRIVVNACLILFVLIGNYLPVLRPNYFAGIRTPWTLANAATWRATHRIGSRIMCCGGLILLLTQFIVSTQVITALFVLFVLGFTLWAFVYSWSHARTHVQAP